MLRYYGRGLEVADEMSWPGDRDATLHKHSIPKQEIRNNFQARNHKNNTSRRLSYRFRISDFNFVSDFDIRDSYFLCKAG
jgi:hypothetical protein